MIEDRTEKFEYYIYLAQQQLGLINEDGVIWFVKAIGDEWQTDSGSNIALRIRKAGKLMTKEELKAVNLRATTKMSHEAYAILSDEGRKDPIQALANTIHWAYFNHSRYHRVKTAKAKGWGIKIWAGTCPCANSQFRGGRFYQVNDLPDLPMSGCSNIFCNCSFSPQPIRRR